jgi:hypothetical protein
MTGEETTSALSTNLFFAPVGFDTRISLSPHNVDRVKSESDPEGHRTRSATSRSRSSNAFLRGTPQR